MTRYFDEMRTALERRGGTVEKFIGDAVMAIFGVPAIHEAMRFARSEPPVRCARRSPRDLDRARRLSDGAIAMGEQFGVGFYLAASNGFRGEIEVLAGEPIAAERATRKEYDILKRLGDEGHRSTTAANLAVALCLQGRLDEAEALADEALELAAEDDMASQVTARLARARVRSARGFHDEAIRLAHEAVNLLAEAQAPNEQGAGWMTLAEALRAAGRSDKASHAARTGLGYYERKSNQPATRRPASSSRRVSPRSR